MKPLLSERLKRILLLGLGSFLVVVFFIAGNAMSFDSRNLFATAMAIIIALLGMVVGIKRLWNSNRANKTYPHSSAGFWWGFVWFFVFYYCLGLVTWDNSVGALWLACLLAVVGLWAVLRRIPRSQEGSLQLSLGQGCCLGLIILTALLFLFWAFFGVSF